MSLKFTVLAKITLPQMQFILAASNHFFFKKVTYYLKFSDYSSLVYECLRAQQLIANNLCFKILP